MATYKAGIIGLGFIGGGDQLAGDALGQKVANLDGTHAEALGDHSHVDLVAGSNREEGKRQRFAERTGARIYSDWRRMLDEEQLDIVSVATYTPAHAEITIECARRGIRAVYCEKPIAPRVPDAEQMVRACEEVGTLLVLNHNRRFDPNARRLRDYIQAGGLGRVTSVMLQWGAGRLGNVGTHVFDAMQMLTGERIEAVSGTLDLGGKADCRGDEFRDPGGWGVMRLEGGAMVLVDAADYATTPIRIVVSGTEGRATSSLAKTAVVVERHDGSVETWAAPPRRPSGMDVAVAEIVDHLDGTKPFDLSAALAVHALEAILAFHASHARDGAWCTLPLTGEDRQRELLSG